MDSPSSPRCWRLQSCQTRNHLWLCEDLREEAQEQHIALRKNSHQKDLGRGLLGEYKHGHNLSGWWGLDDSVQQITLKNSITIYFTFFCLFVFPSKNFHLSSFFSLPFANVEEKEERLVWQRGREGEEQEKKGEGKKQKKTKGRGKSKTFCLLLFKKKKKRDVFPDLRGLEGGMNFWWKIKQPYPPER